MLVCSAREKWIADCLGIETWRECCSVGESDPGETRRGIAELAQRLHRRHDLCFRRNGAYAGAWFGNRRDAATVGHNISLIRLRTAARPASERGIGRGKVEGCVWTSGKACACAAPRQQQPARHAGGCPLL